MIDGATRRRLLVEGLDAVAERHRAQARLLRHIAERKMSPALEAQAEGECELVRVAEEIRDQFKDGG